jgi:glutaredoxin
MEKEYDSYVSGDGKLLFPEGIALTTANNTNQTGQKQTTIPKKTKADAKLFVMAFCPYGNQAEELMKPVVDLLGSSANIEVHYIVSKEGSKYSSLHGDQEANQDVRELCVAKYQKAKYWDFILAINKGATAQNVDSKWEEIAKNVGVDVTKIKECQQKEYNSLLDAEIALSQKYGVEGSPTLVINDVTYQGNRTANAYKEGICSGFQNPPAACSQKISDSNSSSSSGSCN